MRVSIGVPIYNSAETVRSALDSLLAQTHTDLELVISDNASTDETAAICQDYAARDPRIRYIRQAVNLGADGNFVFVLAEARADYFMWAAADDTWAADYVERNLAFLAQHLGHVGSMGPATFIDNGVDREAGTCGIEADDPLERVAQFLRKPGFNSRFYSVFRTSAIRAAASVRGEFLARDWAIIVSLLLVGKLHVLPGPPLLFRGNRGVSSSTVRLVRHYRTHWIEHVLPLFRFSSHVVGLTGPRADVLDRLLRLNVRTLRNYHRQRLRQRLDAVR